MRRLDWCLRSIFVGTVSSPWVGHHMGQRHVFSGVVALMLLGLLTTLFKPLAAIILGLCLFTFGFFGALRC